MFMAQQRKFSQNQLRYYFHICKPWDIMIHISKEILTTHALTIPWLPFRYSEPWLYYTSREVSYHHKEKICVFRICHILFQYNFAPYFRKENKN